ncbi:MAG: RloB family protein [Actinomycetia bacterium]|nr:RloB family protein [Actinomycetes bacterium]
MKSRRPSRQARLKGLVLTEGEETEKTYLEQLRQSLPRQSGTTFDIKGLGKDPVTLVRTAIRLRRHHDWVVCLVDVDQHAHLEQALREARSHEVQVVVSNPCFEIWLRWHLEDCHQETDAKTLHRRLATLKALEGKTVARSFPFEQRDDARRRAHAAHPGQAASTVGPNPSSPMAVLLDLIGA